MEVLKAIRLAGDCTPFIVLTAAGGEAAVIEALNAGADQYFRKGDDPVAQMEVLAGTVRRLVAKTMVCCPPVPLQSELRMILDSSDEPMVFMNLDRTILWANQSLFKTLGFGRRGCCRETLP